MGSFIPLVSPFLKEKGFSGVELGTALGLGALATIIMQPVWGAFSDRYKNPKSIILILTGAYSITGIFMIYNSGVAALTAIYILFMGFFSGVNPITDSMVLGNNLEFGRIRLWGAIGFAIGAQVTGILAQTFGLSVLFLCILMSNIVAILITLRIDDRSHAAVHESTSKWIEIKKLLSNPGYLVFLLASFLIGGTLVANNSYFGLLYGELGGSVSGIGLAFLLFAGSEAPVMSAVQKFSKGFNLILGLMISSLIFALRYYWYGSMPAPKWILIFFFIQGLSIGSYLVLATLFIKENTHPSLRATAIGVYFSLSTGVGGMLTQYFSGIILDRWGLSTVYNFYFLLALTAALLYLILYLIQGKGKAYCRGNKRGVK